MVAFATALASIVLPPHSFTRISFFAGMMALSFEALFATMSIQSTLVQQALSWQELRLYALAFVPGCWTAFSVTFARGNYREFLSRWWPAIIAAFAIPSAILILSPKPLVKEVHYLANETTRFITLGPSGTYLQVLLLVTCVVVLTNLESTLRAAVGVMRWRIKFVVLGVAVVFLVRLYTSSQKLLYRGWNSDLDGLQAGALIAACLLVVWAVTRAGLAEADVYPSRKMIVGSVVVSLIGVYLLVIGGLAKWVSARQTDSSFPLNSFVILVGLTGLGVLAFSDQARQKLGLALNRHFRRPAYDYRNVWQSFTERTASLIEEPKFCRAGAAFISETFHALSVTIWVVENGAQKIRFGGSTMLAEDQAERLLSTLPLPANTWQALEQQVEPVHFDQRQPAWAHELQTLCPEQFPDKGGTRLCLPLRFGERMVGLLFVGDRVKGLSYSLEEYDLLRTLAVEVAAGLLNSHISRRLVDTRETQAIRMISSFFAHDLKNTASTLSLTLQNMQTHYENPEFREDAFHALSKCVGHINEVVEGLSTLQRDLTLNVQKEDLSILATQTLHEISSAVTAEVSTDLTPHLMVQMDAMQIKKVLVNLMLNARDATSNHGCILIQTFAQGRWGVLSVKDDGCGMSAEFVRESLFRPFQTTKKKGLGIGMFHSKMIIEAHRGLIDVESTVGTGTAFKVLLPLFEEKH